MDEQNQKKKNVMKGINYCKVVCYFAIAFTIFNICVGIGMVYFHKDNLAQVYYSDATTGGIFNRRNIEAIACTTTAQYNKGTCTNGTCACDVGYVDYQ